MTINPINPQDWDPVIYNPMDIDETDDFQITSVREVMDNRRAAEQITGVAEAAFIEFQEEVEDLIGSIEQIDLSAPLSHLNHQLIRVALSTIQATKMRFFAHPNLENGYIGGCQMLVAVLTNKVSMDMGQNHIPSHALSHIDRALGHTSLKHKSPTSFLRPYLA